MKKATQKRKSNFEDSRAEDLVTTPAPQTEFKEERLWLECQMIKNHLEEEIIGCEITHLALKNENTYMVATDSKGLKVILKATEIFSGHLPPPKFLGGVVYVEDLDSFILSVQGQLYRKDIDDQPPYLFMRLSSPTSNAMSLRYSSKNRRLISFIDSKFITVINLDQKKI